LARCFGFGREKVLHETLDFISRDENVSEELAEKPAGSIAEFRRNGNDRTPHANDASKLPDELAVAVGLRANGIDDPVRALDSLCDSEVGEIVNVDGLQAIVTCPEDSEDGEVAEHPGNVVDEDVLTSEENGRTEDRVRKPGFSEVALDQSLPAEVLKGRILRWIRDADVDYAGNSCATRRGEEGARVVHGLRVAEVSVIEAHPVGVVQNLHSTEGPREPLGVVEVEGMYLDSISERMLAIGRIGEGPDAIPGSEQPFGDVAAGIAEGTRYNVQPATTLESR
jgi:hypothetical protein